MRIVFLGFVFAMAVSLPAASFAQGDSGLRPLSPETAATLVTVENPVSSPDGRQIVYSISDPQRQETVSSENQEYTPTGFPLAGPGGLSLRVFDVASGKTTNIISAKGSSWGPAWSPDSRYLAFYSDRTGKATLWVWDSVTGKSRQISPEVVHPFFAAELPVWSADGTRILVKLLPQGMTIDQMLRLNPLYASPKTAARKPNTAGVTVYSFHPEEASANAANAPDASAMQFADARFLSDLAIITVANGRVQRIASHSRAGWYAFSPDSRRVAYMQMQGWLANSQQPVFDLRVVSLPSGAQRTVVAGMLADYATGVSWSPDSQYLTYQTAGQKADNSLYLLNVADGSSRKLAGPLRSVTTDNYEKAALWTTDGKTLYTVDELTGKLIRIAADGSGSTEIGVSGSDILGIYQTGAHRTYWSSDGGRSMLVQLRDVTSKKVTFCLFDTQAQRCTATLDRDQSVSFGAAPVAGSTDTAIAYTGKNASDPGSVWTTTASLSDARRISNANSAVFAATLGKTELIDFTSLSGEHLRAALILPANYVEGKRYPLMLWVYGGEMGSEEVDSFGFWPYGEFNMQILASRGYAIVFPDVPIHTARHAPMQDVYDAAMPAIDKVIAMGIADPNKIGVMGQSFGGYNTISLITQSTRFAAAIATSAAPTDLFEAYSEFNNGTGSNTGYYEQGQGNMSCTPWECRDRYLENSPFFFLDKVRTPLLMERGSVDDISIENGEVFTGLRRLGQEVTLLEYADEGHVLEQPANIIDFWSRVLAFLKKHMPS